MKKIITLAILLTALASCSDSDTFQDISTPPDTGTVIPPVTEPTATFSYTKNAKSIIDANCIGCHQNGRSAGFRPLTTYAEVKAAVESAGLLNRIQLQTGQQGIMPQAGRMSQANIDVIVKWNTDGLKEN
ncbi:cytochrome c [Flavobacterium sp. FlaQc-48]|uniref:cytochrome c n=1 Tax=Flavobacterium sp. FlaQc-48 TaxID=3374181 RepID=UPI0037573B61